MRDIESKGVSKRETVFPKVDHKWSYCVCASFRTQNAKRNEHAWKRSQYMDQILYCSLSNFSEIKKHLWLVFNFQGENKCVVLKQRNYDRLNKMWFKVTYSVFIFTLQRHAYPFNDIYAITQIATSASHLVV